MSERWKFYAAPASYFSAKIRPALRYKRVAFDEYAPTAQAYKEVILPLTGVRYIPVVITDQHEVLQDTPRMLVRLEELVPEPAIMPADPAVHLIADVIQDFADEAMLWPAMHFRWNYPEQRDWIRTDWEASFGGDKVDDFMNQMNGSLPFLGIGEGNTKAIEDWFHKLLDILTEHFKHHRFLLGDTLTLADLAMVGPMYAHLGRDPVPADRMRERAPLVMAWVHEVNDAAPPVPWATEPKITETLAPFLEEIGHAFVTMQTVASRKTAEAAAELKKGEEVPRVLGMADMPVLGKTNSRFLNTYAVWRHARTAARYNELDQAHKAKADEWLGPAGVLPYFEEAPQINFEMHDNKLFLG